MGNETSINKGQLWIAVLGVFVPVIGAVLIGWVTTATRMAQGEWIDARQDTAISAMITRQNDQDKALNEVAVRLGRIDEKLGILISGMKR